jgi:hypothetical protein
MTQPKISYLYEADFYAWTQQQKQGLVAGKLA